MATKIKYKPNQKVSNLSAPTLNTETGAMDASWTVPSAMTKSSSKYRATNLDVSWILGLSDGQRTLTNTYATSKTSVSIDLNSFSIGGTAYTRSSFYPYTDSKLTALGISVAGTNTKGSGDAVVQTRSFITPSAPTMDEITFNTSTGICSTTVRTEQGDEYQDRVDTKYRVTVRNTRTGATVDASDGSSTSTEFNLTYDASDYQNLAYDQHILVTVTAYNRGYAGDSAQVSRNLYVSYPAKATISGTSVSAKDSTGKLTVAIKTNESTEHPVDTVKLEYLANTTYEESGDIPANASWTDSGIEDNGDCAAIAMPVSNLVPDRGRYTWIRVKTIHLHEGLLYRYSEYKRLEELETPAAEAAEDSITILSATSGAGGESAVVVLGWNTSGTDDSTGTELTWSDEEDTWKSTKEPESHEFTWSDGELTYGGTTYHDSATITVKGLSEGEKYYIRARRFYEGDTTAYGAYSNTATVVTSEKPSAVVANCNSYVADGDPLPVYWTFSGNGLQTEWQIISSSGTIIANGEGSIGGTQISAKRLADLAENNTLTFTVQVSTGSGFVSSESRTVTILQKPTLSLTVPSTLTVQPFSFTASSSRLCDLIVIVTSQGASGQFPEGSKTQTFGDTIHSDVYSPAWSNGSATITLPKGLGFWNLGSYTLSVTAVDRETGLRSDTVENSFRIAWSHSAADPDEFITLTPIDTITDDESEHLQGVQIALTAPTGSNATDVYDIYRMDGDKTYLIGEGFPLTHTVIDEYAPFCYDGEEQYYRIALRTADGDVEYADKEYVLVSETVRFDWNGGSLELPYDLSIGDNYKKSVDLRQHMDGSVDGYWNPNIERGASYSSNIVKLDQPEEINLARQLARYAGPVFVRTATGSAFAADVQVSDMSASNRSITAIAIDATEVGLTSDFMLPSPFEQEE